MVFGLSLSGVGARAGRRFVRESVPHRAIVSDYVPADWGPRNWTSLSAVPDEWEPLMSTLENPLERNHKGPVVGKI